MPDTEEERLPDVKVITMPGFDKALNEEKKREVKPEAGRSSGRYAFPVPGTARLLPPDPPGSGSSGGRPRTLIPERDVVISRTEPTYAGPMITSQPQPLSGLQSLSVHLEKERGSAPSAVMKTDGTVMMSVLEHLAQQVVWEIVQELLGNVLTADYKKSYSALRDLYAEISSVYLSNNKFPTKLLQIASAMDSHASRLALHAGEGRVRHYLENIAGWIHVVAERWSAGELLRDNVKHEETYLGKLMWLTAEADTVLSYPAVSGLLGKEVTTRLQDSVRPVKNLFVQLHALRSRPGGMQWLDYLSLITAQSGVLPTGLTHLLNLGDDLAKLHGAKTYPAEASVPERLMWIIEILSEPQVLKDARPLLGDDTVRVLEQMLGMGHTALEFPSDAGLHHQILWLTELLSRIPGMGNSTAAVFLHAMRQVTGDEKEARELFDLLMKLADPQASRLALMGRIGLHIGTPLLRKHGPSLAYGVVKPHLPVWAANSADFLRRFMSSIKPGDKWVDVAERLTDAVLFALPKTVLQYVTEDPRAAQSLQLATEMNQHDSFRQSLLFIVTQAKKIMTKPEQFTGCIPVACCAGRHMKR